MRLPGTDCRRQLQMNVDIVVMNGWHCGRER